MPQIHRPSTVVVTTQGETHLKITLELNINLNSNGVEATISAAHAKEEEEVDFKHVIPDFSSQAIEFGKSVDEDV